MNILIPIRHHDVASRFDLTSEVCIAAAEGDKLLGEPRIILLPEASGEDLCGLVIKEHVTVVICGGIEETHYQYLAWKKVKVIDGVIGPYEQALEMATRGQLKPGTILPGAAGQRKSR